jgi:deaminated glutathione amidase
MRVAVCQIPVSVDPAVNAGRIQVAMADAAAQGAELAVFPEGTQARFGSDLRAVAEPLDGPFATEVGDTAAKLGLAVVAGLFEPAADGRVHNTTVAFDAAGQRVVAYRKIHVFDSFGQRESDLVAPGDEPVLADLAGLRVGFLTCYDVRFPEHARALVGGGQAGAPGQARAPGADLLVLPSAWAAGPLKEEHWVTLVRARAIENTVWIAATGQVPDPDAPPTRAPTGVGRSMVVDPLGVVRLDLGSRPGVGVAEIDTAFTAQVRAEVPCLQHRRPDIFES